MIQIGERAVVRVPRPIDHVAQTGKLLFAMKQAGRSLGRYQPADKLAKKRELIGEIISFFDL